MIQSLDVLKFVNEIVPGSRKRIGGHGMKHEGIVGVGAVPDSYDFVAVFVQWELNHEIATCMPFKNHPFENPYNRLRRPGKSRVRSHSACFREKPKQPVEVMLI